MSYVRFASCVLVGALIPLAASAIGPNLLANGDFDEPGIEPWSSDAPAWSLVSDDVDGCSQSAGFEIVDSDPDHDGATTTTRSECLATAVPEATYRAEFALEITQSQDVSVASAYVYFYNSPGCPDPPDSSVLVGGFGGPASWTKFKKTFTVPVGTQSVQVVVLEYKTFAVDAALLAVVDRFYLGPDDFLFGDGFEVGATCRWSAAGP